MFDISLNTNKLVHTTLYSATRTDNVLSSGCCRAFFFANKYHETGKTAIIDSTYAS